MTMYAIYLEPEDGPKQYYAGYEAKGGPIILVTNKEEAHWFDRLDYAENMQGVDERLKGSKIEHVD